MHDVIVVGGGAAGLIAAGASACFGKDTLLIEKMPRTARKILVTGKGRCNVTNNCDIETVLKNVVSNPKFLFGALSNFAPSDTMNLFESLGVALKTERGNRVFPVSDRAVDIADALRSYCESSGAKIVTDKVVCLAFSEGEIKGVKTESGKIYEAKSVIVATGGLSYPKTGSTGDGYKLAKMAGHNVVAPRASLVGLKLSGKD